MDNKPLIALFTNFDDDVYCFRLELIRAIIGAGYRLLISCPDGPKFEEMEREGLKKDVDFIYDDPDIDRRGTGVRRDAKLFRHYRRLLKKYRPDAALTYTAKPNVYVGIAAKRFGIPVISNVTGFGSVLGEKGLKQSFIMRLFRFALRRSACVMFQNSANMELARKLGMVKGRSRLIPGSGVNVERFPLADYPDGGDGLTGETVVFNYIGRILHDKGVDDYIAAARRIREKYPATEFNMIGFIEPTESHYERDLELLGREGTVFYRGSQRDVRPFIARSHCLIHPSTYGEGMSNVLLENASSGRFLITTDNPGCRETVVDGETGFIYHGGDVSALCERIGRFLALGNEERRRMGGTGRKYVSENFSRAAVVKAYLEEIERAVERQISATDSY